MVEWAYRTTPLTAADKADAALILSDDSPATEEDYAGSFTRATVKKSRPTPARAPSFEQA